MKIFVSSLISGLEPIRDAARSAIGDLGHGVIMAEDFGARPASPQVACLEGIRHAGLVVLIAFSGLFGCGEESRHDSLKERVETMSLSMVLSGRVPGLVVGWSSGDETGFVGVGRFSAADGRTPNENTLYEIGSISKVFTAVLLAESVRRGHVTLEDPVEEWLPEELEELCV